MNVELEKYDGKKICVAVSGGRDSMALLHYLYNNAKKYGITLTALNCDHGIRGEQSARDSQFVSDWCQAHSIPLIFFKVGKLKNSSEESARLWRKSCYMYSSCPHERGELVPLYGFEDTQIILFCCDSWQGADMIATAHHLNDNAETVLFNLSRGTALSGMTGIRDKVIERNGVEWEEIRPLIGCSRKDIDEYVESNAIPYVTDATNFTLDYTRNRIRHNVLPELEKAVPEAAKAIFRFSRLAAEDEEYFARQTEKIIKDNGPYGYTIATCDEKVIFKRAAVKILNYFKRKDYTAEHAQRLFDLQYAEVGKQFKFLGLTAFKEKTGIAIAEDKLIFPEGKEEEYLTFERQRSNIYCGQYLWITTGEYIDEDLDELQDNMQFKELSSCGKVPLFINVLQYDKDKIPKNCVVRFARSGDKFKKFGGGTKNLGDFFTDKKIPKRLRGVIPLIAQDNFVYVVCGVEISDDVKVDENTKNVGFIVCNDYLQPI